MSATAGVSWGEFARDAPELAERIRTRFAANLHHVLGTIRPDGSPRLSGTEVAIGDHELTLGMMPGSNKLADVRRDPRVEIHTAPLEEDLATGDAKVAGDLVEIPPPGSDGEGASAEAPPGTFFRLVLRRGSLVTVEGDELLFRIWDPERGVREHRRR